MAAGEVLWQPFWLPALLAAALLWPAAAWDRHAAVRVQRCFAAGKLIDLTNGTAGLPECVDHCEPPAERSVQAEGVGFCMLPVVRKEAFDLSFTLELRNVSFRLLPAADGLRANVPIAVGQALQVPPSDVLGEVMIRDSRSYDGHSLQSFKLRRHDEVETDDPADATPAPTKVSPQVALANDSKPVGLGRAGLDRGVRGQKLPPSFGPCRSGFCNMYLTMRCESWRIANTNSGDLPDIPLLVALRDRAEPEVVRQLGLNANWTVLHVTTAVRPQHATPLEVTRADPTFRFAGLPWNYDPLHGNLTGKWNEFGDIDRRLKFEDKALEQILVAFFVLLALMFALLGQQRFVSLSPSAALADSADWHAIGFNSRTLRRPWPMRREARKMLGHRSA